MSDREQIKAYYDTSPETEWARLEQNPWEFEIHCRYIDRYVQPGQSVLDQMCIRDRAGPITPRWASW